MTGVGGLGAHACPPVQPEPPLAPLPAAPREGGGGGGRVGGTHAGNHCGVTTLCFPCQTPWFSLLDLHPPPLPLLPPSPQSPQRRHLARPWQPHAALMSTGNPRVGGLCLACFALLGRAGIGQLEFPSQSIPGQSNPHNHLSAHHGGPSGPRHACLWTGVRLRRGGPGAGFGADAGDAWEPEPQPGGAATRAAAAWKGACCSLPAARCPLPAAGCWVLRAVCCTHALKRTFYPTPTPR